MGTCSCLESKENVAVVHLMETEILRMAKQRKFSGVFSTNINRLTQVYIILFLIYE